MRFSRATSAASAPTLVVLVGLALATVAPTPVLAGCPALGSPRLLPRHEIPYGLGVDPPIDTTDACPNWRWVAIQRQTDTPCPDPGPVGGLTWQVESLFASDRPADLPPALRPFCLYTTEEGDTESQAALNQALEELVRQGDLIRVESGCAAVGKTAEPSEPSLRPHFESYFLAHAEPLPPRATDTAPVPPRVRLAILDTQPGGELDRPRNSDHGFTLAKISERLLCPGPGSQHCTAEIVPRLALPISDFDWEDPEKTTFDWEKGGFFGTIDQLAQAVWAELEAAKERKEQRLVINLSVAWSGERFGGLEKRVERMPVPVQAVHRALEVASCRGALVVAATGNRLGGPEIETGPLLPGGWERRRAPRRRACRRLLGEPDRTEAEGVGNRADQPLVYAVGGIHGDGAPLVNARPDAEPPRVAFADHAVVVGDDGSKTAVLTGSSVATSVVASAAAAIWHHRPELRRAEVMDLVRRSGETLKRRARVHLGTESPDVRRIAVCPAVAFACGDGGRGCGEGAQIVCPEFTRDPPKLSDLSPTCTSLDVSDAFQGAAVELSAQVDGHDFCDTTTLHYAPTTGIPSDPCPDRQYFDIRARPWTAPQPETNPCSGCPVRPPPDEGGDPPPVPVVAAMAEISFPAAKGSSRSQGKGYRLEIDIDSDWSGGTLYSPVLGIGRVRLALELPELEPGDCALVEGLDPALFEPQDGRRPAPVLHFATDHGSVDCPLFLSR